MGSRAVAFSACVAIGCGEALLPSDFAGTPALNVSGNVLVTGDESRKEAERPHLALAWLTADEGRAAELFDEATGSNDVLVGQTVTYQRSAKLANDWDIGLGAPSERVKLKVPIARTSDEAPVRLAIAKLVYFDDLAPDGRLQWSCADDGASCDQVKAVSDEFVVYLERPVGCLSTRDEKLGRTGLPGGYHVFLLQGGQAVLQTGADSVHFRVTERNPGAGETSEALRSFATAVRRFLALALLDGC